MAMPTIALFNDYGALDLYSSDAAVSEPDLRQSLCSIKKNSVTPRIRYHTPRIEGKFTRNSGKLSKK